MNRARPVVVAALALLLTASCVGKRSIAALDSATLAVDAAAFVADDAQTTVRLRSAHAHAGRVLDAALDACSPGDPAFARRAFLSFAAAGDLANASLVAWFWQPLPSDPDAFGPFLDVLVATGRAAEAEALAWQAAVDDAEHRSEWIRRWYAAMATDTARFPRLAADLRRGPFLSELDPFTGQSSIILKVERDGDTIAVFKPHQRLRHQSHRGEIASYRLCHLIRCTFRIPTNREAWFEESEFRALVGVDDDDNLRFGTRRDLLFVDQDGKSVLYGVIKDWVPDFTRFPVEYTDVWWPLVRAGVDVDELRATDLTDAIRSFAGRPRGFYRQISERAAGMTAYDLARQLSELHVFDALINNFDRYQPEWYGMNVHWESGGFVSIDNGASFSLPEEFNERATRRRLRRVEVFSRSMIDAIRWIEPDAAFALLFPENAHFDDERARFDRFLERRDWLLAHVDGLVEEHGEEAVYIFP